MIEYKSENVGGNLHDMVAWLNSDLCSLRKDGWELIAAQYGPGNHTIAVFKRTQFAALKARGRK